jgi:hypothetical protein
VRLVLGGLLLSLSLLLQIPPDTSPSYGTSGDCWISNGSADPASWQACPGGSAVPSGLILATVTTCPAGWTEQTSFAGRSPVATTVAAGDVGTTGGSDSVTPTTSAISLTAAAQTFTGTSSSVVLNHTHTVSVTDPGHTHVVTSQTATTGGATSYEHGVLDTSSAEAEATEVTASGTTGITASTANPGGGAASYTPAGTNATSAVSGTVTLNALDNRSAWVKLIYCKKD